VNSEPPGPAFFEFQGVPRDPVLRPKNDPPVLMAKRDQHFMFFTFYAFTIFMFYDFFTFYSLPFFGEGTHFDHFTIRLNGT